MKEKIKTFFAICILVVTVPYIITFLFQGEGTSLDSEKIEDMSGKESLQTLEIGEMKMDAEEYLAGVVAREIPLDVQPEALRAQTVIARTSLMASLATDEKNLPEAMSREEMIKLWGQEGFEKNYGILEEAIADTSGEILTYEDAPVQAEFHAVSAGRTRDAKDALNREDEPYLSSVDSEMDIPSPDYLKVIFMEKKDFMEKLKKACPELEVTEENVMELVTVSDRDESDYVTEMKLGEKTVTGEEFRRYLDLNSACFYIKEVEGKVRIVTKGLGHGLGLSQYGANELAKEGLDYKEILGYYYKDVKIEKADKDK